MGWPAGFKLNAQLDNFMGELFLMYNHNWYLVTKLFSSLFPFFIDVLVYSSPLGVSFSISLFADYIEFANIQIYFLHLAITKVRYLKIFYSQ